MRLSSYFFLLLCISMALQVSVEGRGTVKLKFRVIDQDGSPVEGVHVGSIGDHDQSLLTDKNGVVQYRNEKVANTRTGASRKGYYASRGPRLHPISDYDESQVHTIVLKKILNPIPMYAKGPMYLELPVPDKEIGYDMEKGDWVAPYGEGLLSDFLFKMEGDKRWWGPKYHKKSYYQKISISFDNKHDGLIPFIVEENSGSDLKSDHEAPTEGYIGTWEIVTKREEGGPHETTANKDRNYYFRVRTKVDEDGKITSANYGKIYCDFMSFTHYFNPTTNDRNVEFDPDHNLMTVPFLDKVRRP